MNGEGSSSYVKYSFACDVGVIVFYFTLSLPYTFPPAPPRDPFSPVLGQQNIIEISRETKTCLSSSGAAFNCGINKLNIYVQKGFQGGQRNYCPLDKYCRKMNVSSSLLWNCISLFYHFYSSIFFFFTRGVGVQFIHDRIPNGQSSPRRAIYESTQNSFKAK